jgi:HAD superfamily hydrolase (TIGR01450 family)
LLLRSYSGVVLDLDGVVVLGTCLIPGADAALAAVRDAGVGLAFVTNNATRTAAQVVDVLRAVGVPARHDEVVTSAMAAADLLEPGTRCLVIGMEGLHAALEARGCTEVREPGQAQAVVVGLDRDLRYDDLRRATLALRRGARFVAANTDRTFPAAEGLEPGAGAIVAALVAASDRQPEVAGKPHAPLFETAAGHLPAGRLLMVGDRLDTDIAGAAALGWDTALVLTGVATALEAAAAVPPPTYVAESLAALVGRLSVAQG